MEGNSNELFDRFLSRSGPTTTSHITLTGIHTHPGKQHHHQPISIKSAPFAGQNPGDEIELIMTENAFQNGQEARFVTQQSRKISQNSSNSGGGGGATNGETKVTRPGSRSPDNNDTQEWVSCFTIKDALTVFL